MDGKRRLSESYFATDDIQHHARRRTFRHDSDEAYHWPEDGSSRARYTVAWICALAIEMAAARAMLDEFHETPAALKNDNNTYLLGRIKMHDVVIACLPNAQYGTNNAAIVLTNLRRTFPNIRAGLMVGIGGGVPTMADIRLGDVVVGTRVMQYDLEKVIQDGEVQRQTIVKTPSHLWGTTVSALRAKHELSPSALPSILQDRLPDPTGYGLPNLPDRLFTASYKHVEHMPNCDECEESKLAPRRCRPSPNPLIHYGAIASGNKVMRSATERDQIARKLDAVCFEMEAAGLMDILDCLPIRGICDYSDSHKNKDWQKYAAATAAAYAKELLEELPASKSFAELPYMGSGSIHQNLPPNNRTRILESLKFEQIDARKLTIKSAHAKTCKWFLKSPDYQAWLDPEQLNKHHGFIWIRGKPGSGKSTLMKFLYSHTKSSSRRPDTLVASFFFNARGGQLEKTISGMYRSLLLQLFDRYPDLQAVLDDPDLISQHQTDCPSLVILKELFCNAVSRLDQRSLTCFIDALDECDEQQVNAMVQDLEDLAELSTERGTPLRICFSSRHYPYIVVKQGIELTLENQPGHEEDLLKYVGNCLRIRDFKLAKDLQERILAKAAGVFLWVVLVVDILNNEYRRGQLSLRKRLAEIPSSLSELFKDMLRRDQENMEDLLLCILWILCAKRPLKPEEYYHAIWSGLYAKELADEEMPDVNGPDIQDIVKNCVISSSKGLAEITKSKNPTVQFIHESVRDFLVKDKGLYELWPELGFDWESPSHDRLKQCCMTYMNHPSLEELTSGPSGLITNDTRVEISKKHPFLEYANQHVLFHANNAALAVHQAEFLSTLMVPDWIKVNNLFEKFQVRQYNTGTSLLYVLAEKNLANLVRVHPQRESCFKIHDERYGTPIFAALALQSYDVVETFLEILAQRQQTKSWLCRLHNIYSKDIVRTKSTRWNRTFVYFPKKSLLHYLDRPYERVILSFLPFSVDCDSQLTDKINLRLLLSAAEVGDEVEIKRLLGLSKTPIETQIENTDELGCTPLSLAAASGHEMVVKIFLDLKAELETKDHIGFTPLIVAIIEGHEAIVKLLLNAGAQVNTKTKDGKTPLHYSAQNGNETVVTWLLDLGAEIEKKDEYQYTPIFMAAENGHTSVVERFLNASARVDIETNYGRTPLSEAAENGHETVVKLLLKANAKIEARDNDGQSPVFLGAIWGHVAVVKLLLEANADIQTTDNYGRTPLSWAAEKGQEAVVKLLLEANADIETTDNDGRTPLSRAAEKGQKAVVKLLLEANADTETTDKYSRTPLSQAVEEGYVAVVKLLLEANADIETKDKDNQSPLCLASKWGRQNVVQLLLKEGAEIETKDKYGRTPLSLAAMQGHGAVVKLLIEANAEVMTRDNTGRTPLSWAESTFFGLNEDVKQLLKSKTE